MIDNLFRLILNNDLFYFIDIGLGPTTNESFLWFEFRDMVHLTAHLFGFLLVEIYLRFNSFVFYVPVLTTQRD